MRLGLTLVGLRCMMPGMPLLHCTANSVVRSSWYCQNTFFWFFSSFKNIKFKNLVITPTWENRTSCNLFIPITRTPDLFILDLKIPVLQKVLTNYNLYFTTSAWCLCLRSGSHHLLTFSDLLVSCIFWPALCAASLWILTSSWLARHTPLHLITILIMHVNFALNISRINIIKLNFASHLTKLFAT